MDTTRLFIKKIEIESFKKIRNLVIEPEDGANLFFGSFRSGKTSLCEFIQFALYGADSVALARNHAEDALGKIFFADSEKNYVIERSVIGGKEELSFLDGETGAAVDTDLTPGEFLTGMDQDSFDLITYFKQARYETPVFKPKFSFLHEISSFNEETKNIYRDEMQLREKSLSFRNLEGTGSLDVLLEKRDRLHKEWKDRPTWEEESASCAKTLSEIAAKLDENDRRCVLLKADMAGFSDDLKLSRNKENAEETRKSIQAKEKRLRIMHYEVTNKIGLITEEELETMKEDYASLSLAETSLAEARTALAAAEENLLFHKKIFVGREKKESFEQEKKRIEKCKAQRLFLQVFGVILMGLGAALFFVLHHFNFNLLPCLASGGAVFLCGVALEFVSTVFNGSIQKILAENGKANLTEFYQFYDKIRAHHMTTQVYLDQVRQNEENCKNKSEEKEAITLRISQKIAALGYKEEDGELLAICDQIIEANDALYDLQHEIEKEEEEYQSLLSIDVERDNLTVSSEFASLQKELSFLMVQNDSLYKKKALLTARLQEAEDHLSRSPEDIEKELSDLQEKIAKQTQESDAAELNFSVAKARKDRFEEALKETLTKSINEKISFVLGEGESFLFDDQFELCFRDRDSVLPLIAAGGGVVSELGLLAFRLSLAQVLGKTSLPMIFDDSFSMLSPENAKDLYRVLQNTCSQFFIATSSQALTELCQDSAKIFSL